MKVVAAAKFERQVQSFSNAGAISFSEEAAARQVDGTGVAQVSQDLMGHLGLDGVETEERRDRGLPIGGRCESFWAWRVRHPFSEQAVEELAGSDAARPKVTMEREHTIESTWAEFMKVAFIPPPAPRCSAAGCS